MPPASPNPILEILQKKLVPWVREYGMERVLVAQPLATQMADWPNVRLTPKKRRGKRIGARGKHHQEILARWPDDHQIETRALQLVFVTSGQADLHFGDYMLHCNQGEAVFIPAGVPKPEGPYPHLEGEKRLRGACDLLWFRPAGHRIQSWMCHSRGEEHIGAQNREIVFTVDERLLRLFGDMEQEIVEQRDGYRQICEHLLNAFLRILQRDLEEGRFLYPSSSEPVEAEAIAEHNTISRAQQYMRDNLHAHLTIESVARIVHLSRAQFAKRFRQETGQTFTEFLTQCRLEQAITMLLETDVTLTYLCRVLGYRSPTYFNSLFQRHFGVSPLEYRQQHRLNQI